MVQPTHSPAALHSPTTLGSVGLCLHPPRRRVPMEPFWMQLIKGIEDGLSARGMTLLVQVVADLEEEVATHQRWQADGHVAGVIVSDLTEDDPRLAALRVSGLPAVAMVLPEYAPGFATISTDNAATITEAVAHLASNGHRCIGRITGPLRFVHTRLRNEGFLAAGVEYGIETVIVEADYTAERGASATVELIDREAGMPSAIIYDNDVMALGGLQSITGRGLRVPEDVAILAWDDSVHCQLATPPLSAIAHDVVPYGAAVAQVLLDVLDGVPDVHADAPPRRIIARASTAYVRAGAPA